MQCGCSIAKERYVFLGLINKHNVVQKTIMWPFWFVAVLGVIPWKFLSGQTPLQNDVFPLLDLLI